MNEITNMLIVDDTPLNIRLIINLLKNTNIHIVPTNSGASAIEICQKKKFDIILMDIMMPIMNGIETFQNIRKNKLSDAPIVAFTSNVSIEEQDLYKQIGFDAILPKPVISDDLYKLLENI